MNTFIKYIFNNMNLNKIVIPLELLYQIEF